MNKEGSRRLKIIRAQPEYFFHEMKQGEIHRKRVTDIPDDLKFVGCFMNENENGSICMVVESGSFEPVPLGGLIPDFDRIVFHNIRPEDLK